VRRAEEVQPDDVLRSFRRGGDLIDVLVRGIGGEYRTLPAHGVELPEDRLFEFEILEHGLDDEIGIRQRIVIGRAGNPSMALERLLGGQLAPLDAPLVIAIDDAEPPGECLVIDLEQCYLR
jgi:hypothetical protein